MAVIEINAHGKTYWIADPGPGSKIGAALRAGVPYEHALLEDVWEVTLVPPTVGLVIDVGAHVGNHALWFAAVCGLRTLAFEPDPDVKRLLDANVGLNSGIRVETFDWALGRADAVAVIRPDRSVDTTADPAEAHTLGNRGLAHVAKLDDVLAEVEFFDGFGGPVRLIKIDVEGTEPDVLVGAAETLDRFHPILYVEAHTEEAYRAIEDVVIPHGYNEQTTIEMGSRMVRWRVRA